MEYTVTRYGKDTPLVMLTSTRETVSQALQKFSPKPFYCWLYGPAGFLQAAAFPTLEAAELEASRLAANYLDLVVGVK